MGNLLIINGIIDEATQAPYYPEFAVNNTFVKTPSARMGQVDEPAR